MISCKAVTTICTETLKKVSSNAKNRLRDKYVRGEPITIEKFVIDVVIKLLGSFILDSEYD